jgi:hypothetical protein
MSEAAAAGLLPSEALVENRDLKTSAGKALAAEGAGRPSSDDGYILHGVCWLLGPLTEFYGATGLFCHHLYNLSSQWKDRCYEPGGEYSTKKRGADCRAGPCT